jgi:hypothetical protein
MRSPQHALKFREVSGLATPASFNVQGVLQFIETERREVGGRFSG